MPAWIASAMALLFGSPARAALTGATGATIGGRLLPDIPSLGGLLGDGEGKPRRRRRRRALTASDRADIAFIAGMLGTAAGKQFAMLIGTRAAS